MWISSRDGYLMKANLALDDMGFSTCPFPRSNRKIIQFYLRSVLDCFFYIKTHVGRVIDKNMTPNWTEKNPDIHVSIKDTECLREYETYFMFCGWCLWEDVDLQGRGSDHTKLDAGGFGVLHLQIYWIRSPNYPIGCHHWYVWLACLSVKHWMNKINDRR